MFKQPREIQRKVERIKLLNISLKSFIFSRDYYNIPTPSFSSTSSSWSWLLSSSKQGYHLISTPHNISRSKTLLYRLIVQTFLALFLVTKCCDAAKQDALQSSTGCAFPKRWEGRWFQSGVQQEITIEGSTLSTRGRCIASEGDKFLLVNEKGCHRCVVIYQKHINILQYKESECEDMYSGQLNPAAMPIHSVLKSDHSRGAHPNMNGHSRLSSSDPYIRSNEDSDNCMGCKGRETLHYLCEQIPGDALLYSMFKINPEPIKCPLSGSFTFTYNRGHGECKNPVSKMDMCTEDSRLLLNFQACPDVSGTESTVEELTCLAWWKDGNSRYLVGLVSHYHATSNEDRFRCFVYEKISGSGAANADAEYKLAQSGDATCNGLESAEVGSRIMTLKRAPITERCDFPAWFKGPRHWHALMGNANYIFHPSDGSLHIVKPSGYMEARALCEQINKQTTTEMMAVVHHTTGCTSGYMCVMFYRRDTHVAELQMGTPAARLEDACTTENFDVHRTPFVTLLANNPETQICPMEGYYSIKGFLIPSSSISRHKRNHNNKSRMHRHREVVSFRNQENADSYYYSMEKRKAFSRMRRTAAVAQVLQQPSDNVTQDFYNLESTRARRETMGCNINHNTNRRLYIGCNENTVIEVKPKCKNDEEETYTCHGHWQENQTTFIIAKHLSSQHGVCISYVPIEGNQVQVYAGDTCHRPGMLQAEAGATTTGGFGGGGNSGGVTTTHKTMSNVTVIGKCGDTSTSITLHYRNNSWMILTVLTIVLFNSILR
ncbi:uncharacterized protein LOC131676550 isoform X1 [Topomyia yanbarensis]|uniref:uncharacterized protein LOC131676550 isoform X1 n=1 Tax=Topomyia yanbarensis TaxID=2498891 RepID=UPI00273C41EC|nr:uncharacterized protein LOC131676550 isoform X1 [Topomyia yanbarensis]